VRLTDNAYVVSQRTIRERLATHVDTSELYRIAL
jgi:hypothetical protein